MDGWMDGWMIPPPLSIPSSPPPRLCPLSVFRLRFFSPRTPRSYYLTLPIERLSHACSRRRRHHFHHYKLDAATINATTVPPSPISTAPEQQNRPMPPFLLLPSSRPRAPRALDLRLFRFSRSRSRSFSLSLCVSVSVPGFLSRVLVLDTVGLRRRRLLTRFASSHTPIPLGFMSSHSRHKRATQLGP